MSTTWTSIRSRLGNRTAVIIAGTVGFAVGGVGLAAATQSTSTDDNPTTSVDATPNSVDDSPSSSVDATIVRIPSTVDDNPGGDNPSSSTPADPSTSVDATIVSVPTSIDDDPSDDDTSSSTPNTVDDDDDDDDDDSSSSVPGNSVPDSSVPDNSVPGSSVPTRSLPAPFTQTYTSTGGSISVSWSGTAFTLNSVNAADGYTAEVKDSNWDRVRVDFEGDDNDSRIEVRISDDDGSLRVNID